MKETVEEKVQIEVSTKSDGQALPVGFVPTPTNSYRTYRKLKKATQQPGQPVLVSLPPTLPLFVGPRVLMWKQDPRVTEIGIRKAFLPGFVFNGPRDARMAPVSRNSFGDFIQTPGTAAFDAVHTFAVVRQTLTMYQRALGGSTLLWQWNSATNTDPLKVFPYGLPDVMNAFYNRSGRELRFGDFNEPLSPPTPGAIPPPVPRVFTCRSFDIVAHETGHAILDGLKPQWISSFLPQTGGLHESFGDLTAIFLTLSQLDQVEAIIAQTKANLHDKTFLSDLAEQFGLALGRSNGLRNADNNLKLSETGTEVHAISQVFTGGIYDILADIFAFERKTKMKDDAVVLHEVGQYVCSLVLRAIIAAPATNATFANVVNQMLTIAFADGKPVEYRTFIRNRFTLREVVVSPTPLTEELAEVLELSPDVQDAPGAVQDRRTCCGTMQLEEYVDAEDPFQAELEELKRAVAESAMSLAKSSNGKRRVKST
jgi:hypothetical protein